MLQDPGCIRFDFAKKLDMKKGWADKWAAQNEKKSQRETSTAASTASGPPRIVLPLKDALDPANSRGEGFSRVDNVAIKY